MRAVNAALCARLAALVVTGGLAIAPVPTGASEANQTRVAQPQAALDRCDAILQGRSPPVEGLDCSAGQLDQLRRQAAAEAASRPPQTVDVDCLSQDLGSAAGAPEATDPTTGLPAVVVLPPGN